MRIAAAKLIFCLAVCVGLFGTIQCPRRRGSSSSSSSREPNPRGTISGIAHCLLGAPPGQGSGQGAPAADPLAYQRSNRRNTLTGRLQELDAGRVPPPTFGRPFAPRSSSGPAQPIIPQPFPNAPAYAPWSPIEVGTRQAASGQANPTPSEATHQGLRVGSIGKRLQDLEAGRVPEELPKSKKQKKGRKTSSPPASTSQPPTSSTTGPNIDARGLAETLKYIPTSVAIFYENRARNENNEINYQGLLDTLGRMQALASSDRCPSSPLTEGPTNCARALAEFNRIPETFRGICADMLRADCREWPNPLTYRCSFYIKISKNLSAPLDGRWYPLQECINAVDTRSAQLFLSR